MDNQSLTESPPMSILPTIIDISSSSLFDIEKDIEIALYQNDTDS